MSQTNTANDTSVLSRLGTLVVIPWAGAHHEDGQDMPFLMAYSLGDGAGGPEAVQETVHAVAHEAGLPVGGMILDVSRAANPPVKVLVEGGKAVLTMPYLQVTCPVPDQWVTAARQRGAVYVILSGRPWPEAVPGQEVTEETLMAFVGDEDTLGAGAHVLVPVSTLRV